MLLPVGLIIVDFLEIINLLNIEKDRLIGKQTLAVIPRKRFAKGEYLFCILMAFLCLPVLSAFGMLPWWSLFPDAML